MGGLIYCRNHPVKHPYYVAELGLHLYSGEELSYFVYNHTLLVGEDFLGEKLFSFLHELGETRLEERMRNMRGREYFFDALTVLLQDLHYYNSTEMFSFRRRLEELARSTTGTRLKAKADYLFENGQYYAAMKSYDQVLALEGAEKPSPELTGLVWSCKASCFARLEAVPQAMNALEKAYDLLGSTELLEKMQVLHLLYPQVFLPAAMEELLSQEQKDRIAAELTRRQEMSQYDGKGLAFGMLSGKSAAERGPAILDLLQEWKEDFRREDA